MSASGKIIKSQSQMLILNLLEYFEREKANNGPLIPLASVQEDIILVHLISKEENCLREVIDFLLNSECESLGNIGKKSSDVEAIPEYTCSDGPPTVTKENWLGNSRVHFILKYFDPNDIGNRRISNCHTVIMFLSDEADIELILNLMGGPEYGFYLRQLRNLTVIGKWCKHLLESREDPFQNLRTTKWSWNGKIAYNWSKGLPVTNDLWLHICRFSGNIGPTRVSYNSEMIFRLKGIIISFFDKLLKVIYRNINICSSETETNSIDPVTLIRKGNFCYIYPQLSKDLLKQFNISNLSEFNSVLKEEMKQLACHLPRLVILCDEIWICANDPHARMFSHFEKIENFKDLYNKELQSVNKENITEAVLHSLDIMSGMKYTGHYIKNELSIKELNALKEHFRFRNVESDFLYVTETIVDNPLGNGEKEETQAENRIQATHSDNGIQDINIENRIGNIQLLKSLQGTLQEFTEELKNVRHLQENYMKNITEDIRKIREEMRHLKQKPDEVSIKTKE